MSTEANENVIRRYLEHVNARRFDLIEEVMAADVEFRNTDLPPGTEPFKQWLAVLAAAAPDYRIDVDDIIARGDKVVAQLTFSGSHQGEFNLPGGPSIPATGNTVSHPEAYVFRVESGKIAEVWVYSDNLVLMQQLGAVPA